MSESKIPNGFVLLTNAYNGRKVLFPAARILVLETEAKLDKGSKHPSNCVVDSLDAHADSVGYRVAEPFDAVQVAMVRALGAQE